MTMNLHELTITSVLEGLSAKQFSCEELLVAYTERGQSFDKTLNAIRYADYESAHAAAKAVDAAYAAGVPPYPLSGVPMFIKDTIVTAGMPTTAGSKILESYVPATDATVVARLRAAGAILLGKTNCDEFAMGASGENSAFGATKNPWAPDRVPGGSSSGSAAAVAAGECLAALGSDTGGSIRQPAGFCGIVGIKASYGRVSRYGLIALASSLDHIGPLTRTVDDAAIILNVIAGSDPHDATSVEKAPMNLETIRQGEIRGLRIGVPEEYFVEGMDPRVEQSVRDAIALLKQMGADIVSIHLPHTEYALAVYYIIQPAEASSNLARYDGIRYGHRTVDATDLLSVYGRSRDEGLGEEPKRRIMLGTYVLSAGYYDAYYRKAQKVRTLIRQDFSNAFRDVDLMVTPTSPTLPFKLGERFADPLTMYLSDIFTVPADIAGLPSISIRSGFADGLPVGVQLMGPLWSEERVLTAAKALEKALALPLRLPDLAQKT